MPYRYSRRTELLTKAIELTALLVLWPLFLVRKEKAIVNRILLVEPFQMGDVLSLTPMIRPLLRKYPGAEIYVLTKNSSGAILKYDSRIKDVLLIEFHWTKYGKKGNLLFEVWPVLSDVLKLRRFQFDIGIDTRGDIRSQIIMLLTGCRRRVGNQSYLGSNINVRGLLLTHRHFGNKKLHRYLWNLELLKALDFTEKELFPIQFPSFIPDVQPFPATSPYVLIHIGGGWTYKRWPVAKWQKLIEDLVRKQRVIVIGGPSETEIISEISTPFQRSENLDFLVTDYTELIRLTLCCSFFIGLDSGPMNLAVTLNKRVLALFGPGDSKMWYPLTEGSHYVHNIESFACNPCHQVVCYYAGQNCMDAISTNDIFEKFELMTK